MSSSWKCQKCTQLNVGWAKKCGRCESPGPRIPPKVSGESVDDEPPVLKFDNYDSAIVGITDAWQSDGTRPTRLVYSGEKIMEILVSQDGMTHDEAREFISFNTEGAYMGPGTPIVFWPYEPEDEEPLGDAA